MTQDEWRKKIIEGMGIKDGNEHYFPAVEQAHKLAAFIKFEIKKARIEGAEELMKFALNEIRDSSMPHYKYIRLHSLQRKVNQIKEEAGK